MSLGLSVWLNMKLFSGGYTELLLWWRQWSSANRAKGRERTGAEEEEKMSRNLMRNLRYEPFDSVASSSGSLLLMLPDSSLRKVEATDVILDSWESAGELSSRFICHIVVAVVMKSCKGYVTHRWGYETNLDDKGDRYLRAVLGQIYEWVDIGWDEMSGLYLEKSGHFDPSW